MPELPLWLSFTSARNSQFSHSRSIQKRWLAGPSPVRTPFTTFQLSGCSLAFQPFSVLPSNMLIQPSLPGVGLSWPDSTVRLSARLSPAKTNPLRMMLMLAKLAAGILLVMRLSVLALLSLPALAQGTLDYLNHNRPVLDAHNCYPYKGEWTDRIDRALRTGF